MIPGEVIAGVELKAMAIRIPDIKKKSIGDAVATGTAFDISDHSARGHHVTQMQDVHRGRHPIGEVVQAGPLAVGDGKVVHIALAMHPRRSDPAVRAVFLAIFGQPETKSRVKVDGVLHLGGEYVEMVEPLWMAAL